ncbi:MAG: hypothetical protein IM334_04110 [Microcystis sp. M035S1]|nr:hypothetical protein [Microcystis sp. M035S1]
MTVSDTVNEWDKDVQTRTQGGVILAQTLNHPGILLGYNFYALYDKKDDNNKQNQCDDAGIKHNASKKAKVY